MMLSVAGQIVFLFLVGLTVLATPLMAVKNSAFRKVIFLVALVMCYINLEAARDIFQSTGQSGISSKDEIVVTLSLFTSVVGAIGAMAFLITKWVDRYLDYFGYRLLFFLGFGVISFFPTVYLARTAAHA
jgi:hypothetical protein